MVTPQPISQSAPVLITGAAGFIGKNLTARLRAEGYENLLLYDLDSPEGALEEYAAKAKFVFHLAGVNRPKEASAFYEGNAGLTETLITLLEKAGNKAPVLLSSTAQAGNGSDYALSKEKAEEAVFDHGQIAGAPVYAYRLPGVFGKWSRPSYNSVVATFCYNIAHDQPVEVRDKNFELPLCYIDDVIDSFFGVFNGRVMPPPKGLFISVTPLHKVKLGKLAEMIQGFRESRKTLEVPDMQSAFERKLYATYLSYLPEDQFAYDLTQHADDRGSFTEFLRTQDRGQVSVNVAKPGVVKGNHWHNTKNEKFLVVSGQGMIRFRKVGEKEVYEYPVSGEKLQVLDIPTGYTHNIENVGEEDLVTVMWASEPFTPNKPDTIFEEV